MTNPTSDAPSLSRRVALGAIGVAGAAGVTGALRWALPVLARPATPHPVTQLSAAARELVHASFQGVDRAALWDVHTHVVGLGAGGTGCFASQAMQSHFHPIQRLQFDMYLAAAGITDRKRADAEYLENLDTLERLANPDGRLLLLAFDAHVRQDGTVDEERTAFFVPNDYVARAAAENPRFGFIASVHPYRKDAVARLLAAAEQGAVAVKWLPNAMGIDPIDARCDAFYRQMAQLGLVLVSHTGVEQAVHAEEAQELGNPQRLERALDAGVRVFAAHCASIGECRDLKRGGARRRAFDLFLEMMAVGSYSGRLFGEISAVTLRNRGPHVLETLLGDAALHPRLVNGSDYPVIAVDAVISLGQLAGNGFLAEEDTDPLRELFGANALLFDFVLKRRLRFVTSSGVAQRFPGSVFETRQWFGNA